MDRRHGDEGGSDSDRPMPVLERYSVQMIARLEGGRDPLDMPAPRPTEVGSIATTESVAVGRSDQPTSHHSGSPFASTSTANSSRNGGTRPNSVQYH
jgi:hypothetical protein